MNKWTAKLARLFFKSNAVQNPQNILIIRDGAIGDILMSTPLIHNLKDYYKNAELTYLVGRWSRYALDNNPNIDEIIDFDDNLIFKKKFFRTLNLASKLRKKKFDMCFILNKTWHWNVLAWLAGIPYRVGFDRFGEGFSLSEAVPFDGSKYELEYYLDLARKLTIPVKYDRIEFYFEEKDKQFARTFFKKNKLENKKVVILIPGGANNPGHQMHIKRWPLINFTKLANKLTKSGVKIICLGGKEDLPVISTLYIENLSIINLAGQLSIAQSIAIMSKADCIVTPDSGPLHMASAAKAPIVALFGPTPPHRFAPKSSTIFYRTEGCHGCYSIFTYSTSKSCETHECMKNITVDEVFEAVKRCLKEK